MQNPDITYREIQVAIWSLLDFPEFDLNRITIDELPSDMVSDGQYNFDRQKVNQIVSQVEENYSTFQYSSSSTFAVIAETDKETQTVIIEANETVWAYGQHSFRDQELRDQLGITGTGKGQWGWIYELDSDQATTELIAGGGDDDGTKEAHEVGTIVGYLDMSRSGDNLDIKYSVSGNYLISDLHLWVGCSLEEFPWVGQTGNVAPGGFPYHHNGEPLSSHTFSVDLATYNCSGNIFIAAHAGELYFVEEVALPDDPQITMEIIEIDVIPDSEDIQYTRDTYAIAINDYGEVVGRQDIAVCLSKGCDNRYYEETGYKWTRDDGLLGVGGLMVEGSGNEPVSDINNFSQIAGFGTGAVYAEYPYDYNTGSLIEIGGLLGGNLFISDALAINDHSQVVGYAENASGQLRAFIWHKDTGMTDLGTLPGHTQSSATDINNSGQVVGWSRSSPSDTRYFIWDEVNGMTDLGADPIRSINDHGEMSSHYSINNSGQTVNRDGFLYDPVFGAIELPTLEGGSCGAYDVNEHNQVVGNCDKGNNLRAVKWNVTIEAPIK
jgi:probable HAF family extracellular repeat protein